MFAYFTGPKMLAMLEEGGGGLVIPHNCCREGGIATVVLVEAVEAMEAVEASPLYSMDAIVHATRVAAQLRLFAVERLPIISAMTKLWCVYWDAGGCPESLWSLPVQSQVYNRFKFSSTQCHYFKPL